MREIAIFRHNLFKTSEPFIAEQADFAVQGPGEHGIARLVNLFGIESPGLTAALAIAETVATLVQATS